MMENNIVKVDFEANVHLFLMMVINVNFNVKTLLF